MSVVPPPGPAPAHRRPSAPRPRPNAQACSLAFAVSLALGLVPTWANAQAKAQAHHGADPIQTAPTVRGSTALRAADPSQIGPAWPPGLAFEATSLPDLPQDREAALSQWREANQRVAEFPRGHIDLLRWEANNRPTEAPQADLPTEPPLELVSAMALAYAQQTALLDGPALNPVDLAERQRAQAQLHQAVHKAWTGAVSQRQRLRLARAQRHAADTGVELGRRMVQAGNWSQLKLLREQLQQAQTWQAELDRQLAAQQAEEHLLRLLGVADGAQAQAMLARLPAQLPTPLAAPTAPKNVQDPNADGIEAAVLRAQPGLAWQRQDLQRLWAAVPEAQQRAGREALLRAAQTSAAAALAAMAMPSGPVADSAAAQLDAGLLRDHALARALRAEAALQKRAAERRSMAREAWRLLQAHWQAQQHSQHLVSLHTQVEQETLLRYNGMLSSSWDVLASARAQLAAQDGAVLAQSAYWQSLADWQALLGGADFDGARADLSSSTGPSAGAAPGH